MAQSIMDILAKPKGRGINKTEEEKARAAIKKHPAGQSIQLIGAASGKEGTYAYAVGGKSVLAAQISEAGTPDVIHVAIEPFKWQMMSSELWQQTFATVRAARQHVAQAHGNSEDLDRFSLDVVQLHAATKQVLQIRLRDISEQGGFVTVFLEGGEITEVAREAA